MARMEPKKELRMKIVQKPHLKIRLKERKIPADYPKQIVEFPEQKFFDTLAKRHIATKKLFFEGERRNILAAYDIIGNTIEIVTIHVISSKEIDNKVRIGRWERYEEN